MSGQKICITFVDRFIITAWRQLPTDQQHYGYSTTWRQLSTDQTHMDTNTMDLVQHGVSYQQTRHIWTRTLWI